MSDEKPYRGGCRRGMPTPTPDQPSCHPRCLHRESVLAYYDQRDARDRLRESDQPVPAAYAYGSAATYSQLEDADFDAAVPRVTFRMWLEQHARTREGDVA
jgi:hypothetical protein